MKTKLEKSGWLIRFLIVLVVGGTLYYWSDNLQFVYLSLSTAAIIHLIEEIIRRLSRRKRFPTRLRQSIAKLDFLSLTVPFSLYAYVVLQLWGGFAIICIFILGGLLDLVRKWVNLRSTVSLSMAFSALFCSVFTSYIPDIVLLNKKQATVKAENHTFFLRGLTPIDENREDGVIIRQDPPLNGGIFGSRIVFVCRLPHTVLDFLPFPVWKTLRYEMGNIPEIEITGLQEGHGGSGKDIISIENKKIITVGQFTRIYGKFKNLPKNNEQLFLRVLIRPSTSVHPILDRILLGRWYVQPHQEGQIGNKFIDSAELKLIYNEGSNCDGHWHVDGFFGSPYSESLFEVLAMITSKDFKRGQKYRSEKIEKIRKHLNEVTRIRSEDIKKVLREKGEADPHVKRG